MGSLLASCTLDLMLEVTPEAFFGTVPVGSNLQSLVLEITITFLLMFVVSGVSTDDRAVSHSKISTRINIIFLYFLFIAHAVKIRNLLRDFFFKKIIIFFEILVWILKMCSKVDEKKLI